MTDIPPIQGPARQPDNPRRHERTTADADKFKEEMVRKRSQVNETDPEQQKKRKQPAEEEEEEEPLEEQGTPLPPTTPFNLTDPTKQVSPLEMQGGVGKISPLASSQPTTPPPPSPQTRSMTVAPSDPTEDQGDSWNNTPPSTPSPQTPPPTNYPQQSVTPSTPNPETPQQSADNPIQQNTQPTTNQNQNDQSTTSSDSTTQPPQSTPQNALPNSIDPALSPDILQQEAKASSEDPHALFKQKKQGILQPPSTLRKIDLDDTEEPSYINALPPTIATSSINTPLVDDKQIHKKEKTDSLLEDHGGLPPPQIPLQTADISPTGMPMPRTQLTPQMLALFERMAGVMTVMTDSKITETVVTLTSQKFAASVFFGAQIIIKEYASAPKVFNIELNGNPQAVTLFKGNADALMAAFQYGNYNFKVNRLDTFLASERPLFHRKESASGDHSDQPDKGP